MKNILFVLIFVLGVISNVEAKVHNQIKPESVKYVGLAEISLDGTFKSPIVEVIDVDDYSKREYDDGTCLVTTEAFAKNLYKSLTNNPEFVSEYPNFKIRVKCRKEVK